MNAPLARWIVGLALILEPLPGAASLPAPSPEVISEAAAVGVPKGRPTENPEATPVAREGDPPAEPPERLVIPAIGLEAPIVPAAFRIVAVGPGRYREWLAPDRFAAGWHPTSARLGEPGNLVLSGHNNIAGAVFRRLSEVRVGDRVEIYGRDRRAVYVVIERHILPERGQPLAVRRANARWIGTTAEPRLTQVSCWPPWSNSHRLIVIARPAEATGTVSPAGGAGP